MHPLETAGRPAFPFVITVSRIYGGPRDTVLKLSVLFHEARCTGRPSAEPVPGSPRHEWPEPLSSMRLTRSWALNFYALPEVARVYSALLHYCLNFWGPED